MAFLLVYSLKGILFRTLFQYGGEKERSLNYTLVDTLLLVKIRNWTVKHPDSNPEKSIAYAMDLSSENLHFSTSPISNDPNISFHDGRAHCVGYAAFLNSVLKAIFRLQGRQGQYRVRQVYGKISFAGFDLHRLFTSPFFADHDFNVVTDIKSGKVWKVDASLYDYTGVIRVN